MVNASQSNTSVKGSYWYRFHVGECPACGRDASYKERVYSPKPSNPSDRYVHLPDAETYDHCIG